MICLQPGEKKKTESEARALRRAAALAGQPAGSTAGSAAAERLSDGLREAPLAGQLAAGI